ncbi:MAG TPA: hypothetical protein VGJ30_20845, partial [Candidatus Angelobacter sp.]
MHCRTHFSNLIHKDGAFVTKFQRAGFGTVRAGKSARFVAEEFTFQQIRRQRRAIHLDHRFARPPGQLMNQPRQHL